MIDALRCRCPGARRESQGSERTCGSCGGWGRSSALQTGQGAPAPTHVAPVSIIRWRKVAAHVPGRSTAHRNTTGNTRGPCPRDVIKNIPARMSGSRQSGGRRRSPSLSIAHGFIPCTEHALQNALAEASNGAYEPVKCCQERGRCNWLHLPVAVGRSRICPVSRLPAQRLQLGAESSE